MPNQPNIIRPVYWAIRISTLLLLAVHAGLIATSSFGSVLTSNSGATMTLFPLLYLGFGIGMYTVCKRIGMGNFDTTLILILILVGDIIGLFLSPQAATPYRPIVLAAGFVAISYLVESRYQKEKANAPMPEIENPADSTD